MDAKSQVSKGRDRALSALNVAIDAMNIAKDISAQAVFGSLSVLLTVIRDCIVNERDYVELGLNYTDISRALDRGVSAKGPDDLSQSVCEAINQLTTTVAEIQKNATKKKSGRNQASRVPPAKDDKDMIASWKLELNRILHVFNTELAVNTNPTASDTRRDDVPEIREEAGVQTQTR